MLAEITMLNKSSICAKAIYKKAFRELENVEIIDPAWRMDSDYIELEVWKYNTVLFGRNKVVDVVSLMASLMDNKDERVFR